MSVLVTTLAVAGIITAIGVGGGIWNSLTEDDRARERIKQLEAENASLNSAIDYLNNIKVKLSNSKDYLEEARNDFKNGGHVLDDVPLANPEFTSCIDRLQGAITNSENLINDFYATIENNNNEISKEKAKL